VNDQVGSPTSSLQIARATAVVLNTLLLTPGVIPSGVYHLSSSGATTWFEFAQKILTCLSRTEPTALARVRPISSAEYKTPAKRPLNSLLNNDRFHATFGFRLGGWEAEMERILGPDHLEQSGMSERRAQPAI
jgi:dTDP-4-dehydrorhamnose reductase